MQQQQEQQQPQTMTPPKLVRLSNHIEGVSPARIDLIDIIDYEIDDCEFQPPPPPISRTCCVDEEFVYDLSGIVWNPDFISTVQRSTCLDSYLSNLVDQPAFDVEEMKKRLTSC